MLLLGQEVAGENLHCHGASANHDALRHCSIQASATFAIHTMNDSTPRDLN